MVVYKLTNKINGKHYIGQTIHHLERRLSHHFSIKNIKSYIGKAIKKYGVENFEVTILSKCNDYEELDIAEQYWIEYYQSLAPDGYNLTPGGQKHWTHTEQTKRIIGFHSKGNTHRKGKKKPQRFPRSPEHCRKLAVWTGCVINNKPVLCVTNGQTYVSATEAARQLGCHQTKVSAVARGVRNHTKGFKFKYVA